MYEPAELARFTLAEFERGLEGLADEDARIRTKKADGSEMNAISWTVGHVAGHWIVLSRYATEKEDDLPEALRRIARGDSTPPELTEALQLLEQAKRASRWIDEVDDSLLAIKRPDGILSDHGNVGTALMRATLHTWFHVGEINAVRQMLGHEEMSMPAPQTGRLEWHE